MRFSCSLLLSLLLCVPVLGQPDGDVFDEHFSDSTLRVDYLFSGTNRTSHIALSRLSETAGWYGRRHNLDRLPLQGNGQLMMLDASTGDTLYCHSFSTLFQEWQETEEAQRVEKSFENTFVLPRPREVVELVCQLRDTHGKVVAQLRHRVDPADILIRDRSNEEQTPWKYLRKGGDSRECIDVAFVAEGFRESEMQDFLQVCDSSIMALAAHEPFRSMIDRFNFVAVMPPSVDSGVSIPHLGVWHDTPLASSFDTFYSNRYLTTLHLQRLYDLMTGIPFEHFIILANTEEYGGGGIYNSYNMASAKCPRSRYEVIVHEFGHSFGGLGDEYAYDAQAETMYPADTEPWEPNLTTLVDFASKWQDMLPEGTTVPTQPDGKELTSKVGVYEGGGYQLKGVYRPAQECRMKVNEVEEFCPVCQRALKRLIDFYTR
ncbi:MAG: IgA Peptidase M64 [Bacteroidaceae bacterium]|nr:IgA Peptidase M64 [Bacteroidaceae bacterium]